jgi:hypothetical protein
MCRFLLAKSKDSLRPEGLLHEFAAMCQRSHAPDGDWQGDGWGVAWQTDKSWKIHKSLSPIWEDLDKFSTIPQTNLFVVHARSVGFPQHKNNLEFNQPYLHNNLCFVFNGMIRGVKLQRVLSGIIGAQKVFSFLIEEMKTKNAKESLKQVEGMNVGLVSDDNFYILCEYSIHPSYFTLQYYKDETIALACSEKIGTYNWETMSKGEVLVL